MATANLAIVPKTPPAKATPAVKRTTAMREWVEQRVQKGQKKVFSERITVTPELARILLERNTDNRPIYPSKLEQIKSDMNAGRFKLNGESIIVANTGELNDGQHRLTAIVQTNKPQDMIIVFGPDRQSRLTVDTGKARSASDHLALSGWPYANAIASCARNVIAYERTDSSVLGRTGSISTAEVFKRAEGDLLLQECAGFVSCNSGKFRPIAKVGILSFAFYEFAKRKPKEAKTFMDKLLTGSDLPESSPIRILREYLILRPKLSPVDRLELLFRAWNAWITDTPIKQLKLLCKLPKLEG